MGKKNKKRAAHNAQKEKRYPTPSSTTLPQQIVPSADIIANGVSVIKESKQCPHFDKGINLDKFSLKLSSLEALKCHECREGVADRRKSKGTGKQKKNKGNSSIWVCLECGNISCGGVGLPTTPTSHAARHSKQYHHPLVLQFANPNLRWCFICKTLIPSRSKDENGEQIDTLSEFVNVLKARSSEQSRVDVEEVYFGNGSVLSGVKSVNTLESCLENGNGSYMIRGLVNLGNTCFFNSVLQNLLAMDKLRDYFLKLEQSFGPLTTSLKKLFVETSQSINSRNVINPRSFLGSVCVKAPQFKGFQQHDSHELLRCLLDGLCTEESRVQKRSQGVGPTFVDTIFGGQISSTVSCLECGHASVVYEPYLDLSLLLPTKRSSSKKTPVVSRSKKTKLPPKWQAKFRSKIKKPSDSLIAANAVTSNGDKSPPGPTESIDSGAEKNHTSVNDSSSAALVLDAISDKNDSVVASNGVKSSPGPTKSIESCAEKKDTSLYDSSQSVAVVLDAIGDENDSVVPSNGVKSSPGPTKSIESCAEKNDTSLYDSSQSAAVVLDAISDENHSAVPSNGDKSSPGPTKSTDSCVGKNDTSLYDSAQSAIVVLDAISDKNDSAVQNGIKPSMDSMLDFSDNLVQLNCVESATLSVNHDKLTVSSLNISLLDHNDPAITSNGHDTSSEPVDSVDSHEASWLDYLEPSTTTVQDSEISNDVLWEDEPLIKVQESEVILLPYYGTASTSEQEPEPSDFDGFGGLFDEPEQPEPVVGPTVNPAINGVEKSDTDPDGVDDTGTPVSVEKCLAYFTTPELLTKTEHAWQCEQCSKSLLAQKTRFKLKNKHQNPISNGGNNGISGTEQLLSNGFRNHDDQSTESVVIDGSDENSVLCNGKSDSCHDAESCSVNGPTDNCENENNEQMEFKDVVSEHETDSSDDDEVDSKGVKVARDASKRILISRAPPVLTIHLKRFCQDSRGRLSKLSGHVDFRETIDLKPYMDPSCCRDRETYKYRLVGVVEHSGTMRGGHYVAYVRGPAKGSLGIEENCNCLWFYASDAYVRKVSLDEVLQCEAYILFYEEM
ncbi:ubiquitin carboxyl-terminal hydrolase 2-like [Rutidosis leptorrhynchoides]|uniref:ubiquitin carboxyl-terminal hydrolase 2-like n=1 Tax=Rutidosis leptorrhynchoides TaxID=125765 RepID=UPI003A99A7DC